MKKHVATIAAFAFLIIWMGETHADWWSFRGPGGMNVDANAKVPTQLDDSQNVAWKTELPGRGPSGPIVVADKVFVTCSSGAKQDQLYVVCLDRNSGSIIWQRKFWATGRSHCHPLSANAAPTPASDGRHVFAFFSSNDLFCLDLDGNLKWARGLSVDHPKTGNDAGMASSPAVSNGIVVCQVETQADSFAVGIDVKTGKNVWEQERVKEECWASPIIFNDKDGQRAMVLMQSAGRITVSDLGTGDTIWEKEGRGSPIPSSTIVGNRMFLPLDGTTAVDFTPAGEFNEIWTSSRVSAGTSSAVIHSERIYTIARGGIVNCANASDGEPIWKVRVGGTYWSTPVVIGDHLYLFAQDGTATVLNLDSDLESTDERQVFQHKFDDEVFLGSPAVSGNAMFMRSDKHLYKFQAKESS